MISIHALREERDCGEAIAADPSLVFQSTRSARSATPWFCGRCRWRVYFNPRAPRGARLPAYEQDPHRHQISIHALREERDSSTSTQRSTTRDFNPRAPRGARQQLTGTLTVSFNISIHALREERDGLSADQFMGSLIISIHALREERDCRSDGSADGSTISIHALREERDALPGILVWVPLQFQSTRSARSATPRRCAGKGHDQDFNPRAPRGARPQRHPGRHQRARISIHALREERDDCHIAGGLLVHISIHALREERDGQICRVLVCISQISIHALREERDATPEFCPQQLQAFQSTRSARSATSSA